MSHRRDPHTLPHPTTAQCVEAGRRFRAIIRSIEDLREQAGSLLSPGDFERSLRVMQIVTFEVAPLVAAGLIDRSKVDPKLNRAVGRRGSATLENAVLARALTRIGRRARGAA